MNPLPYINTGFSGLFQKALLQNFCVLKLKNGWKTAVFWLFFFGGERMTREQAERIKALRIQGKGYRAIASELGLSRDIVRNYCKANGLNGYGKFVDMNLRDGTAGWSE